MPEKKSQVSKFPEKKSPISCFDSVYANDSFQMIGNHELNVKCCRMPPQFFLSTRKVHEYIIATVIE